MKRSIGKFSLWRRWLDERCTQLKGLLSEFLFLDRKAFVSTIEYVFFNRTFVLLISFHNFGTCIFTIYGVLHLFHPWTKAKNCSRWNRVQSRSLSSPGSLLCLGICGGRKSIRLPKMWIHGLWPAENDNTQSWGFNLFNLFIFFGLYCIHQYMWKTSPGVEIPSPESVNITAWWMGMCFPLKRYTLYHIVTYSITFGYIYIYIPSYYRSSRIQKHMTRWKVNNLKYCQCAFRHFWCWKALCDQALNEVQDASDLWQRPVKELSV